MLKLAYNLSLPIAAVTEKLAFLGRTGSGKTYGAQKLAELMHEADAQFVCLDPVGKWWALRLAADGKSPGIALPVFGGLHGDVPLEPSAGSLIADVIVDRGLSAVVDVSQFESDADKAKFATDFGARFFFRKKAAPSAVHVFIEEAQEFVPQNTMKGEERMLHVWTRIQKLGRNFGIGTSLLSQRPQEVNKKVLNQTELLFVFQLTGPQERESVADWIEEKGIDEDIAADLPKLKTGEPHAWSPAWLRISKVVKIQEKWTYDASSTPKVGARAKAKELSPIDLDKLRSAMAATIERAKADDPKELRKEIARLKKLADAKPTAQTDPATIARAVESAVAKRDREWQASLKERETIIESLKGRMGKAAAILSVNGEAVLSKPIPAKAVTQIAIQRPQQKRIVKQPALQAGDTTLGKCERAILQVLSQYPDGCQVGKLTLLAGYRYSGSFQTSLSSLRTAGLMEGDNKATLKITPAGEACGPFDELPTGQALRDYWLSHHSFGKCEKAILSELFQSPAGMTAQELCSATGYGYSGSFQTALSNLRTAGVLVGKNNGTMKASEELF